VVRHAPTPKGRGHSVPQFWGFLSIYAYILCRRTSKFHTVTHMGWWLVFRLSATPPPQGGGVKVLPPQFWGFPSIYEYILCRRTIKLVVTHVGELRVSWGQPPPIQIERSSSAPQFSGFSCVYAYTL